MAGSRTKLTSATSFASWTSWQSAFSDWEEATSHDPDEGGAVEMGGNEVVAGVGVGENAGAPSFLAYWHKSTNADTD